MGRPATAWKTVRVYHDHFVAEFEVGDNGKVRLTKPSGRRLQPTKAGGVHPAFTLDGTLYFRADLVAQAHLGSKHGFIFFRDGDPENLKPGNIVVVDDPHVEAAAMMMRKRERPPSPREWDRKWWGEDNTPRPKRTVFI